MKKLLAILLICVLLAAMVPAALAEAELIWWGWTPGSPVNESFIEAFNQTYPDIKVTWKQVSIDDYDATIKPALAYGEGVDIFECSAGSANGSIEVFSGQAIDLTPAIIEALGEDYADKLSETSLTTMTVNGELKALGVGTVYAGNLWINKDLFDSYDTGSGHHGAGVSAAVLPTGHIAGVLHFPAFACYGRLAFTS